MDTILHTPTVVQNTLVGPLRNPDRRMVGSRPNQNDCFFFVIVMQSAILFDLRRKYEVIAEKPLTLVVNTCF